MTSLQSPVSMPAVVAAVLSAIPGKLRRRLNPLPFDGDKSSPESIFEFITELFTTTGEMK